MRPLLAILLLVLAAACTQANRPAKPIVQAKDLQPLGPCSDLRPGQPRRRRLRRSAKTSMVLLAVGEWGRFGKQVITYSNDAPPRTEQLGIKEREAPQRIADYWAAVGNRLSGLERRAVVGGLHLVGHRERRRAARSLLPRPAPHDLCRAHRRAREEAGRRLYPAPTGRICAEGRRPDLRLARGQRHDAAKPESRRRTLRHRGRGSARARLLQSAAT